MTFAITTEHADHRHLGSLAHLDTGTGHAAVLIFGDDRVATPATPPTSAPLVQISLTKPAGTVANGLLTLTQLDDGLIATTGVAKWARIVNGNGDTVGDCDCGKGLGAWEVQLADDQLYAGGAARITSAVLG